MLTSSHHRTGLRHTYVDGRNYRIIDDPAQPIADFRGFERRWSGSNEADALDWTYRLKPDSKTRKNVIVDLDDATELWSIDLWFIEPYRVDFLLKIRDSYHSDLRIFSEGGLTKTIPWIHAIASTHTDEALREMYESMAPELRGAKFVASVIASGPPNFGLRHVFPIKQP
jgi:hypothetical protein